MLEDGILRPVSEAGLEPSSAGDALCRLAAALGGARDLSEVSAAGLAALLETTGASRAVLYLAGPGGVLHLTASGGLPDPALAMVEELQPEQVLAAGAPVLVSGAHASGPADVFGRAVAGEGGGALALLPIPAGGRLGGAVALLYDGAQAFEEEEVRLLLALGEAFGAAVARTRAEHAFRGSERRLRLAVEAAGLGTWEWDMRSGEVTWSENLEGIHGLPPGGFAGTFEAVQQDMHPEDRDRVLGLIRQAVESGGPYESEYRIVRPDGEVRWLAARGQVVRDDEGRPAGMAGVCTDVTARKEAEQRRATQHAITRILAASATIEEAAPRLLGTIGERLGWGVGAVWMPDARDDVLRCVGTWSRVPVTVPEFLALTRERTFVRGVGLPGRVWAEGRPAWIPDVVRDARFLRAQVASRGGLHAALGFPLTRGDRVLGVMELFSHQIRSRDEELLEMTGSIGSQIGQFVERARAEKALRESERRFRSLIERSSDGIMLIGPDGLVAYESPSTRRLLGNEEPELVGRHLLDLIHPDDRSEAQEALARLLEREGTIVTVRSRVRHRDGSWRWVEGVVVNLLAEPAVRAIVSNYRDITEQKLAEEERSRLFEAERQARGAAEMAGARLQFLLDASTVLSASLDFEEALQRLARLAVAVLCDFCLIDVAEGPTIRRVAAVHADPSRRGPMEELSRYPPQPDARNPAATAMRTGRSELCPEITEDALRQITQDEAHLQIAAELGAVSYICVPLVARARVLGALTLVATADSGRHYDEGDLALAEDLARRASVAIENARLYRERSEVARTLQRSLLPPELPVIPGVEIAARYRPAGEGNEVGGDFYDVHRTGEREWRIVIGDVCGKGPAAAAVTGLVRHTIRTATLLERDPVRLLHLVNEAIMRQEAGGFCTIAYAILHPGSPVRATTVCAGHPPPVLLRAGGTSAPAGRPGTLLGFFADPQLAPMEVVLEPGDALVFYTDGLDVGLGEASSPQEDIETLLGGGGGLCAETIAARLEATLLERGGAPARDDAAILVVRVLP